MFRTLASVVLIAFTLLAGAACGQGKTKEVPPQSFQEAVRVYCRAAVTIDLTGLDGPARQARLAEYLEVQVTNEEFLELMAAMSVAGPAQRASMLDDAVRVAQLPDCPTAALFGH